jgi:hypothetical protein
MVFETFYSYFSDNEAIIEKVTDSQLMMSVLPRNHCRTNIAEIFQVANSIYIVGRREPILMFRAHSLIGSTSSVIYILG